MDPTVQELFATEPTALGWEVTSDWKPSDPEDPLQFLFFEDQELQPQPRPGEADECLLDDPSDRLSNAIVCVYCNLWQYAYYEGDLMVPARSYLHQWQICYACQVSSSVSPVRPPDEIIVGEPGTEVNDSEEKYYSCEADEYLIF